MAEYKNIKELFVDTCNAIREKTGTTELINHNEIADTIRNMSVGGGGETYDNTFADYIAEKDYSSENTTIGQLQTELNAHVAANPNNEYDLENMIALCKPTDDELKYDENLIDATSFTLPKMTVVKIANAFSDAQLETIDVSNVTISPKMKSLESVFNNVESYYTDLGDKLTNIIGLSNWNTNNIQSMKETFKGNSGLTSLDLSGWDATNVKDMRGMFQYCKKLETVKLPTNINKVSDFANLFSYCSNLKTLDAASNIVTNKAFYLNSMFDGCSSLTSLDVSNWDTSNVGSLNFTFDGCSSLTSLDVANWKTQNVYGMNGVFSNCSNLTSLDLSGWDVSKVKQMSNMFENCSSLTSLNLTGWDTSSLREVSSMFSGCSGLTTIDVTNWNTSNISMLYGMFNGCSGLTSLDLSGWNTQNVQSMNNMFSGCDNLTTLNLSNWNFNNFWELREVISRMPALTTLNISNWKFGQNLDRLSRVIDNCPSLTSLDVSTWDTSNIRNINSLINACPSIASISFGAFFENMKNNVNINYLFGDNHNYNIAIDFDGHSLSKYAEQQLPIYEIWSEGTEEQIACFEAFANSLGAKQYEGEQYIYISSSLYDALTEGQRALITNKGYILQGW